MRHIKTLAVMVLSAVVMALQAVAQKPTPPPASPEEKLLSRAEIEAKLGQPIITSKQISDAMTEFYGFSLDEFCDLLKPAEGRLNVNFQPKDDKAADRLKQALFLAGNKSTGIEEEYEVFVRDTNSYEIVSVEPDSTGQKLGLKLGPITWKELDSTYQEALNRIGQQVGLKLGELIEDEPDGVRAGPRQKTFNWEVKQLLRDEKDQHTEDEIVHLLLTRESRQQQIALEKDQKRIAHLEEELSMAEKQIALKGPPLLERARSARGKKLLSIINYRAWSNQQQLESLLGVRVVCKFERKTKLSKSEYGTLAKANGLSSIEDPTEWGSLNDDSWKQQATLFNNTFAYAVPGMDFYPIHCTITEASGMGGHGSVSVYWPNKTYQILKIRNGIKDLSFAAYRQKYSETVVFYSGSQAILVNEIPNGKLDVSELLAFMAAHPDIAKTAGGDFGRDDPDRYFHIYHFPYKGGVQIISQVYVDAGHQQMIDLKYRTIYCQEGDSSRAIDVISQPNDKLKETVDKETVATFLDRYKWFNGGGATAIAADSAFTNNVTEGTVTKQPEAIQGGYFGLPIDRGLIHIHGGMVENHNMRVGCAGSNYQGHLYDMGNDDKESNSGNFVGYTFVYGKSSLMAKAMEFSSEWMRLAPEEARKSEAEYQKNQEFMRKDLYRLQHQGD